jgi:hypothetical protein
MGSSGPTDGDLVVLDKESVTGQFVRTAVCLSAMMIKPVRIKNIRQNPSIQLTGKSDLGPHGDIRNLAVQCFAASPYQPRPFLHK